MMRTRRGSLVSLFAVAAFLFLSGYGGNTGDDAMRKPVAPRPQIADKRKLSTVCDPREMSNVNGDNATYSFPKGRCVSLRGSGNLIIMSPGSCLLKVSAIHYFAASCKQARGGSCLTDLGNGNRAIYSKPCPGGK